MFRSCCVFLLCLLVSIVSAAQTPDAPSAVQRVLPSAAMIKPAKPSERPRAFDRTFKIWMIASFAATVADIEATQHGITACNMVETNPLLGQTGSRARMYAVALPITAGYNLLGWHLKRKYPNRKIWMLMPAMNTTVHAGAAAYNWSVCH